METVFPFKDIEVTAPHILFPSSSVFVDTDPLHTTNKNILESIPILLLLQWILLHWMILLLS